MTLSELLQQADNRLNFRFERKSEPQYVYYMVTNTASCVLVYARQERIFGHHYKFLKKLYDPLTLDMAKADDWMFSQ